MMQKLFFLFLASLSLQALPASAKPQKIGDWEFNRTPGMCTLKHNGWGKNIDIVYVSYDQGTHAWISFYGLRVDTDVLWGGDTLVVESLSGRKGSFFYHREATLEGWGIVSSIGHKYKHTNDYSFERPTIYTLFEFLNVIGGGGAFTLYEDRRNKEIVSFSLSGTWEASAAMIKCLSNF